MTDEQHDPQHDPQPDEAILARTDPKLILDIIQTGVETVGVGYALYKGHGDNAAQPQEPQAAAPQPETPAEPSQPEASPMPGFNE